MHRLYVRVYLALMGSLLAFALLIGLVTISLRLLDHDNDDRRPWVQIGADIATRLLPLDRDAGFYTRELEYWKGRTGYAMALASKDGQILARSTDFPETLASKFEFDENTRIIWRQKGILGLALGDGRRLLVLRIGGHDPWLRSVGVLAVLLGIGLAIAVCVYPVVRHLTRNLERLQQGVAELGAGNLNARVPIRGKDEIAKLGETFNASAERIQKLMAAHKSLLANASHELRSPLARLRMAIETNSGQDTLPAKGEIVRNIDELNALIDEILLASRLDADGQYELASEQIDLIGLLAEECARFDVEIQADIDEIHVTGDSRLLRRVVRNLLENAERHAGNLGVTVIAAVEGGSATVLVCDRGPGIPEGEREKIFEPFYRLSGSAHSGGSGLGLALVRQIAERHGGTVICLPRNEGGVCFRMALPAVKS